MAGEGGGGIDSARLRTIGFAILQRETLRMEMLQRHCTRGTVLALAMGLAWSCHADEIVLRNGDRIQGSITTLTDGKLIVTTDYAGEIAIDVGKIASVRTDTVMTVVLRDGERRVGVLSGDGQGSAVAADPDAAGRRIERAAIAEIRRGRVTGEEWRTTGHATLGASESAGNTRIRRVNLDAETILRNERHRFTLGARTAYATDHGREAESNALVSGKYDRFLSRTWYAYVNGSLKRDKFGDIDLRSTIGAGSGYQIFQGKLSNWQVEGGLDYVNTSYYEAPNDDFPGVRLATRYDRWFGEDVAQVFFDGSVTASLEAIEEAFARTQVGLRLPLHGGLLASLQLNLDWDGNPAPGRESVDRTVVLGLGYRW